MSGRTCTPSSMFKDALLEGLGRSGGVLLKGQQTLSSGIAREYGHCCIVAASKSSGNL